MSEHHRRPGYLHARYVQRPIIERSLPRPCADCGRMVMRDQAWQVAHITPVAVAKRLGWTERQINAASNLGASHTRCNRKAGGKLGAATTNARKTQASKRERGMPTW